MSTKEMNEPVDEMVKTNEGNMDEHKGALSLPQNNGMTNVLATASISNLTFSKSLCFHVVRVKLASASTYCRLHPPHANGITTRIVFCFLGRDRPRQ